jgi:uncharacterized oxidoreductase
MGPTRSCSTSRPSSSSREKVNVASCGGAALPEGALIGPDGASTDPAMLCGPLTPLGLSNAALGEGAIRAFGPSQGIRLGADLRIARRIAHWKRRDRARPPFREWHVSLYGDPARVDPSDIFDDVTRYLDWFKLAKPKPGQANLPPGEPERASKRLAEGVPLTSETWEAIAPPPRSASA